MLNDTLQELSTRVLASLETNTDDEDFARLARELGDAAQGSPPDIVQAVEAVACALEGDGALEDAVRELQGFSIDRVPIDESMLREFLDDRMDSLEELQSLALELEGGGGTECLDAILRLVHSIKGDAGLLDLSDVSAACHELENDLPGTSPTKGATLVLDTTERIRHRLTDLAARVGWEIAEPPGEGSSDHEVELPEPDTLSDVDKELAGDFVMEAREHLESIDANLLALDGGRSAEGAETVNALFRAFHTVKGLAGFLNLNILMHLAHHAETMLDRVRSEEVPLTDAIINTSFEVNDALKELVTSVEASLSTGASIPAPKNFVELAAKLEREVTAPAHRREPEAASSVAGALPDEMVAASSESKDRSRTLRGTIKVDATRLDQLIDTIGELVIAEAMVSQCDELTRDRTSRLPSLLGQLDKTTRELQEMAMSLRMIPIRSTFRRMARLARDVAHKLGKRVELVTQGDDTELDKTVVDVIGDPLVHLIRNAIDHGIEPSPDDRLSVGKPAVGRIDLRAFHEGGSIHVEIADDGRGLDREKILARARSRGLVSDDADSMSDSDVFGLIFAPGFSTAEVVTEVSGRGVGLDVVRRNIEGLRGRIDIRSTKDAGSVFTIRLPLTLAIIDGMVVRVSDRRYIVPTLSIIRMFRPREDDVTSVLGRGHLLRVGDELVSLHRLDDVFGVRRTSGGLSKMSAVVVESATGPFAFLVDELIGQQQIVIKPLGETLVEVDGFSGGAIMPDGTVGLILDIAGLADVVSASHSRGMKECKEADEHVELEH